MTILLAMYLKPSNVPFGINGISFKKHDICKEYSGVVCRLMYASNKCWQQISLRQERHYEDDSI